MPRSLWTGSISFGLVNVPVRLYSAISEHALHFHLVHEKDGSRIGYEKICRAEDRPVPDDEIVRAFEYEEGEYVYMTEADFDAAKVEGFKTIDIRDFVPYEQIDPIYFRHTYLVGPQDGAERVYALLRQAMQDSALAAIAKFVMRDRQHLGCLRVRDGLITLEQMYFADEVRATADVGAPDVEVDPRELDMAAQLIDSFTGTFDPTRYSDTYRDALCEIIEAKRRGDEVHSAAAPDDDDNVVDLMEALRQSLGTVRGRRRAAAATAHAPAPDDDLDDLTRDELYDRARHADIPGRSKMSRDELIRALHAA